MTRRIARPIAMVALLTFAIAGEAAAWPATLMRSLAKDARRLLPGSLAALMAKHEREIVEEAERFPGEISQALQADLLSGRLQPATVAALEGRAAEPLELLRAQSVSEGVIKLGAMYRVPADLSDPVLSIGGEGYPAGVAAEYYAFIESNLPKIPVVMGDRRALRMQPRELPDYWQGVLERSRTHSPVIGTELFVRGRLVDHRTVDFRSPVFGVASLAYSRAVNAIAATWLALWRAAQGDLTRQPAPAVLTPADRSLPLSKEGDR